MASAEEAYCEHVEDEGDQDDEGKAVTEKDVIHLSFDKISHGMFQYVESRPLRKDRWPFQGGIQLSWHTPPGKAKKQKPFSPIPRLCYKLWHELLSALGRGRRKFTIA